MKRVVLFCISLAFFGLQSISYTFASDTDGPRLTSWKFIGSNKADISTDNAIFEVEVTVTDESSVRQIGCAFNHKTIGQGTLAIGDFISVSDTVWTFRLQAEVRVHQATGEWVFNSCWAEDSLGNSSRLYASDFGDASVFVYDAESVAKDKAKAEQESVYNDYQKKLEEEKVTFANRKTQTIIVSSIVRGSILLKTKSIRIKSSASSNLPISVRSSTSDTCLYVDGKIQLKSVGRCVVAFSQDGNDEFKAAVSKVLAFKIVKNKK